MFLRINIYEHLLCTRHHFKSWRNSHDSQIRSGLSESPNSTVYDIVFVRVRPPLGAQMVKNLPAVWETWVWSLGWEDPLEVGMGTHSSTLAWRIPVDRGAWRTKVHGVTNMDMTERLSTAYRWYSTRQKTQFHSDFNTQDVILSYKMSNWQKSGFF